jgi:NAD(P)-dependent dehydrogenase (short-subunit alcohol dehydrogenase family)
MGKLDDKIVFIAGGASNVGGNITLACLRAGATVVTTARDRRAVEEARRLVDTSNIKDSSRMVVLTGDINDETSAAALRTQLLREVGTPDAVIAMLGTRVQPQRLLDTPLSVWNGVLHANLTTHFLTARTLLPPMMKQGAGAYLLVSAYGGEVAWPDNGAVSVAAGGVIGLGRNLAAECRASGVRVQSVVLVPSPTLWPQFDGRLGAFRGDDIGGFMVWLASEGGSQAAEDVVHYVTDWKKANLIRRV